MALPGENVKIALSVLQDIFGKLPYVNYDQKNEFQTGAILLASRIQDGYEGIYLNVKNITPEQLAEFNRRRTEVNGNSSFVDRGPDDITAIGWF
jgi:hypothetical protein